MSLAATRQQIPEFLRSTFDRNLPDLRDRVTLLDEQLRQLFAGHHELLQQCVKGAHDLAGSFGVFGLTEPAEIASDMEAMLRAATQDNCFHVGRISLKINDLLKILEV